MINFGTTIFLLSQAFAMVSSACFFITSNDAGCDDEICFESWKGGVCQGEIWISCYYNFMAIWDSLEYLYCVE